MTGSSLAPSSREKILDVAEALFARRGFSGVGLREVALAVGLGKSSLFHHFPSKASLYLAVFSRVLKRIHERLGSALASSGTVPERLDRCVDALIDSLAEHPASARLLLRGLFEEDDFAEECAEENAAVEATLAGLLGRIHRLLVEGIKQGHYRPGSAAHALQTVIGATVFHFASGDFGERMLGGPLFSAEAVRRRKNEVKSLLHHGLQVAT